MRSEIVPKNEGNTTEVVQDIDDGFRTEKESEDKKRKRRYKRELKVPRSPYPYNNTGWIWELK